MKSHPAVSLKRIFAQLKYDLIGKDSYRGITLSYAFLANQIGHFSLAFIPAYFTFLCLKENGVINAEIWAGAGWAVVWFLFELVNFLGPLLSKKNEYVFTPQWINIGFDTATDIAFFTLGGLTLAASQTELAYFFWWPLGLFVVVLIAGRYWYTTKIYQQTADFPFQYRLSQWMKPIKNDDKKIVLNFLAQKYDVQHLLLFGPQRTGKTSLAVALANELAIQHKTALYTTGTKLMTMLYDTNEVLLKENKYALCTWRTADYLVIDDINPGDPIAEETITADLLSHHINVLPENAEAIRANKMIWVLGNVNDKVLMSNWVELFNCLGIKREYIHTIKLG
jgi:hypothetical protein